MITFLLPSIKGTNIDFNDIEYLLVIILELTYLNSPSNLCSVIVILPTGRLSLKESKLDLIILAFFEPGWSI